MRPAAASSTKTRWRRRWRKDGYAAPASTFFRMNQPSAARSLLPAAVVTPHIGGSSAEALAAVGEVISVTTLAALRGEAVPNAVNLPAASLRTGLQRLTTACGAAVGSGCARTGCSGAFGVTVEGVVPADVVEHVVAAALSEALQRWTNQRVTPVNARLLADERGIRVRVVSGDADPSIARLLVRGHRGRRRAASHHVTVVWDRHDAAIMEVDGFTLNSPLAGDVLITHRDQPGVIGSVGTILARHDVNIAGMQVGRHLPRRGGEAIMVLNVDDAIPAEALDELKGIAGIETAFVVSVASDVTPAPIPRRHRCALLSLVPPDRDPRHARGLGARRQRRLWPSARRGLPQARRPDERLRSCSPAPR